MGLWCKTETEMQTNVLDIVSLGGKIIFAGPCLGLFLIKFK